MCDVYSLHIVVDLPITSSNRRYCSRFQFYSILFEDDEKKHEKLFLCNIEIALESMTLFAEQQTTDASWKFDFIRRFLLDVVVVVRSVICWPLEPRTNVRIDEAWIRAKP